MQLCLLNTTEYEERRWRNPTYWSKCEQTGECGMVSQDIRTRMSYKNLGYIVRFLDMVKASNT